MKTIKKTLDKVFVILSARFNWLLIAITGLLITLCVKNTIHYNSITAICFVGVFVFIGMLFYSNSVPDDSYHEHLNIDKYKEKFEDDDTIDTICYLRQRGLWFMLFIPVLISTVLLTCSVNHPFTTEKNIYIGGKKIEGFRFVNPFDSTKITNQPEKNLAGTSSE